MNKALSTSYVVCFDEEDRMITYCMYFKDGKYYDVNSHKEIQAKELKKIDLLRCKALQRDVRTFQAKLTHLNTDKAENVKNVCKAYTLILKQSQNEIEMLEDLQKVDDEKYMSEREERYGMLKKGYQKFLQNCKQPSRYEVVEKRDSRREVATEAVAE